MIIDIDAFWVKTAQWFMGNGLRIALIILGTLIALALMRMLTRKFTRFYLKGEAEGSEKEKRIMTLSSIIRSMGFVLIGIVSLMMILAEFGVDLKPILAAAGIGGLAIGFGAQNLVRDVISGFFILLENQIRVGDVVQADSSSGLVEKVGLRVLILRDFSGNVHIIPNGSVNKVVNMTKDFSRYVFDIGVAYREDVDEVMEVIKKVDRDLRDDPDYGPLIIEPMEVFGLDKFDNSALVVKARITTRPIMQWKVAREFNRRLKRAFDKADIEIPFPHTTLYFGQGKDGTAPPAHVALAERMQAVP